MKLIKRIYPKEDKTVHAPSFYLAFDSTQSRPIYVTRGRAAAFDFVAAERVHLQLERLGFPNEIVDDTTYPFNPTKKSKRKEG